MCPTLTAATAAQGAFGKDATRRVLLMANTICGIAVKGSRGKRVGVDTIQEIMGPE
jgi:hypothetical protein